MAQDLLKCDYVIVCGSTMPYRGDFWKTVTYARARGWHIYQGTSLTGKYIDVRLCPSCIGTPRSKLSPAPQNLDGQLELDLGGPDE